MHKSLYLFLMTIVFFNAIAQNNSFENWNTKTKVINIPGPGGGNQTSTFDDPISWSSSNLYVANTRFNNKKLVTKDTISKFHLNASVRLRTDSIRFGGGPGGGTLKLPGILISGADVTIPAANPLGGNLNINNINGAGFPYTATPKSFFGYYRYTATGTDSITCYAQLRKNRQVIATALFTTNIPTSGNAFARFEADFIYTSCASPDTLVVLFSTTPLNRLYTQNSMTIGTTLWVDSVGLNAPAGFTPITPLKAKIDFDTVFCETVKFFKVINNDDTCGNGPLTMSIVNQSTKGWSIITNNEVEYTPYPSATPGNTQIMYKICNGAGVCDSANIDLYVNPKLDAKDDNLVINCDTMADFNVRSNDLICSPIQDTIAVIDLTALGTTTIVNNQVHFVLSPTATFGSATIRYTLCDKTSAVRCDTASLTINFTSPIDAVNDRDTIKCDTMKLIDVLANDNICPILSPVISILQSPAQGQATVVGNKIQFLRTSGFTGNTLIRYLVCDLPSGKCDSANLIVNLPAIFTLAGDNAIAACDTAIDIDVRANDTYCPNFPDTMFIFNQSAAGRASVVNNQVHFVKNNNAPNGPTTVTYRVCNKGLTICNNGTININIQNGNINARNDTTASICLATVSIQVLNNDLKTCFGVYDSLSIYAQPSSGTAVVAGSNINYTPLSTTTGMQRFVYRVCDSIIRRCDTASIFVNVQPLAAHSASKDSTSTIKATAVTIKVLTNDQLLTCRTANPITIKNQPLNGSVSIQGDSAIVYTPNASFVGLELFEYNVCNQLGTNQICDFAKVYVSVIGFVGIDQQINNDVVSFYPNPAKEFIHVQSSAEILELHMSDLNGREIATEQNLPSGLFKMDVSQLNKGIYFIQLKMGDNRMINHKFIIE